MFDIAEKDLDRCRQYGICDEIVACSSASVGKIEECVGRAREMISLLTCIFLILGLITLLLLKQNI